MKPWGHLAKKSSASATPASDRRALDKAAAPPVEVSSAEPWSVNIHTMSQLEVLMEIVDHVKRLRAEVASMRATLDEHTEQERSEAQDFAKSRGDMTGIK